MSDVDTIPTVQMPKIIWLYWHQGFALAPQLVQACVRSWVVRNPEWEVFLLDQQNLNEFVSLDIPQAKLDALSLAKRANLIRLELLSRYGGVWADATTFCMSPLDGWIEDSVKPSGIFFFYKPGPDRLVSNWFIAALPGSPLIIEINRRILAFHCAAPADKFGVFRKRLIKFFSKRFNRKVATTRFWLIWFFPKILRIYPYFIFHYIFADILARSPELNALFEAMPKISASNPHLLQVFGLFSPITEEAQLALESPHAPLYKLHWRAGHGVPAGSVLERLLSFDTRDDNRSLQLPSYLSNEFTSR